jgi:polar amino acid transport system substrate-binding protein
MNLIKIGGVLVVAALVSCASPQSEKQSTATVREQVAPTGKVRVAILVGPTAATFRATLDPETKRPRGVPVDLATALGARFALPVEQLIYSNYIDLLNAAARGEWDVTFIPFDQGRAKIMDYGPAYYFFDFTYLVPPGSAIRDHGGIDRPGIRIAVAEGSVTASNREKALKNASLVRLRTLVEIREQLRAAKVDAAAASRDTLVGLAEQVPGARVLDGRFHSEAVAVAVPKGRSSALTHASEFMESAKATGVVRRAFDNAGFKDAVVAPAGSRPE